MVKTEKALLNLICKEEKVHFGNYINFRLRTFFLIFKDKMKKKLQKKIK